MAYLGLAKAIPEAQIPVLLVANSQIS